MTYTIQRGGQTVTIYPGHSFIDGAGTTHLSTWAQSYGPEDFEAHGIVVVDDPVLPPTLAEQQAAKSNLVTNARDAAYYGGWAPTTGPLAGHRLQLRNETDRTNWLGSMTKYQMMVAQGLGAQAQAKFRTQDNETVVTTYQQGLETLLRLLAWAEGVMQRSWDLKDAINAASTIEAVSAIELNGFPTE